MPSFTVNLTHDIDRTKKTYQYLTHDIKKGSFKGLGSFFTSSNPYWMFDEVMKIEDSFGVRSTFFFLEESMPFKPWPLKNWFLSLGRYKFEDVKQVIRDLDAAGWEIGLHGSYRSYNSYNLIKQEKDKLEQILEKEVIGIRQHHLNLNIPQTWKLQKKAGFQYDASYGQKGNIGFRDHLDRPFKDKNSGLTIIPLTLMECYLMAKADGNVYKAWSLLMNQIDNAEKNGSVLSVLWHQRYFNEQDFPGYKQLYIQFIKECKRRNAVFKTSKEIYNEFK